MNIDDSRAPLVTENKLTLPSFAKINLSLHVMGRRADNLHEIRTILQTITLHDTLTFESDIEASRASPLGITCDDPTIPTDERNLVHKAAQALQRRYKVDAGARIHLEKRIPTGGGLGGGSSNAAAALLALNHLWRCAATRAELTRLAATLGADVPFFLYGGTALGTGTGTEIAPLADAPHKHIIVVTPRIEVSTATAYARLSALPLNLKSGSLTKPDAVSILPGSHAIADFEIPSLDTHHNDFESVVFRQHPEIEAVRDDLLRCGARRAMLSGSGASVFGIFESELDRASAAHELRRKVDWRVFDCMTLARAAYEQALPHVFICD